MAWFVAGLVLFLGTHSLRVFAEDWRTRLVETLGENMFKGLYSLTSLLGFVLLVYGFGLVRWDSPLLWVPPVAMRHVAALLMLVALVWLVATYVPHNSFKARLRHPMVLSVKVWALAHLLANGRVVDLILFGAFLLWAVLIFRASRQRDRQAAAVDASQAPQPTAASEAIPAAMEEIPAAEPGLPMARSHNAWVLLIGVGLWVALLFGGHAWLFGVSPLGM
ncbi:MAG: protein NrnU [Betaproteobacteria bacterium]|nr:protein NrnU [Betaproteobacteria bacterium]